MRLAQSRQNLGGTGEKENDAGSHPLTTPIIKEIYIEACPRTVLEFLTDEEKMARWLADSVMRLSGLEDRKLRVRFREEQIEQASITIVVNGGLVGALLPRDTIWDGNSWAQSSVIEIEVRPEGSGTRVKLMHAHLAKS
jgi:uncharacterized protein YndB with AHSA1/START domain